MRTVQTCLDCGRPASVGPNPSDIGTERGDRPYPWSRTGAAYLSCAEHGPFSVWEETVDDERVNVAVFQRDSKPGMYWVIREG